MIVFNGATPCLHSAIQSFKAEAHVWKMAGAKGLIALDLGMLLV